MTEPTPKQLLEVAMQAAHEAGQRTLAYFQAGPPVEWKADGSPVTPADVASEQALRRVISLAFPNHGILGEEQGESPGTEPFRWVIDPLDGTRTFLRGVPLYGVLVGVEARTEPVAGVIYLPALGEMIAAARGEGCTWNGRPCRVSQVRELSQATLVVTSPRAMRRAAAVGYEDLARTVRMERTWGDCYGHALVATGRADIAIDTSVAIWDLAAVLPIIEEAGGLFTDWRGRRTARSGDGVSTNGLLHAAVLEALVG